MLEEEIAGAMQAESFAGTMAEREFAGAPLGEMEEEAGLKEVPEIRVDLDAEYFKWKEEGSNEKPAGPQRKGLKSLFGKKS